MLCQVCHSTFFNRNDQDVVGEQKMQEKLAAKDPGSSQTDHLRFVPTPGRSGAASMELSNMSREQLQKELSALRDSEKWTGLDFSAQKAVIKKQLLVRR